MTRTYNQYKSRVLGRGYDVDGYYGKQCWDGYADYSQWLGYPVFHCTTSGYVKDIYNNRSVSGILNYFVETETLQPGDVVIFKEVANWTPYSHIAIFDSDAGNGFGWFLGQNQGGPNGNYNLVRLPYSATFTYGLRPKLFVKEVKKDSKWDPDAVLVSGDVVKSSSMEITGLNFLDNMVQVPDLGGWVPISDVGESSNSEDGKVDQELSNLNARVYLKECTVTDVDAGKNLVKIKGRNSGTEYWIKPDKLSAKRS